MDEARASRERKEVERRQRIEASEDPKEREERSRLKDIRKKKEAAAEHQKQRDAEECAVRDHHDALDKKMTERSKDRLEYLLGQSEIFARLTDGGKGGGTTMSSKSDKK